ncbi:MFS transporter [Timonella senegalensis]|uniref:MFS transporter n=1 Tax=Timonella senegalensis TaxID=1465825 RepID=UPI0002EBF76C|nr:MFS transporter [Timonella senegalensis]
MPANSQPSPALWTKDFTLATIANFFVSFVFYLLIPTMALYAVNAFGASDTAAGLASSSFVIGAVVGRIFTGKYLDFVGRRRLVIISLGIYVALGLAYVLADGLPLFVALRTVHGFGFGTSATVIAASVMSMIPPARRAEGTGYFGISGTIATAIGPLLALTIADRFSYDALFITASVVALLALLVALTITFPEREVSQAERESKWSLSLGTLVDAHTVPIASIMLLAGFAYSGVLSFLANYAQQADLVSSASLFFLVYAIAVFISRLFIGRIQDRRGDNIVIYPIFASFVAGFVMLGVSSQAWHILLAAVFMGFGFGALMPALQSVITAKSPLPRVGLATATFFLMLDIGTGIGPIVLGLAIPHLGYQGMYFLLAGIIVVAAALYAAVHGRFARTA